MKIRTMHIEDYEKVYDLWIHTVGMGLNTTDDSKEGITKYLLRNPDTCFVAEDNGRIIGVIISGHDGRRGFIYHTTVKEEYRGQGIGKKLVFTFYYFICIGQQKVGAIRIIDTKETGKNKRISPIFILPEFQGKGIAQEAIRLCEEVHGDGHWELDTILQEPKNCHLYEKMGYRQTSKTEVINERLTLILYEK